MPRGDGLRLNVRIGGQPIKSCTHVGEFLAVSTGGRTFAFAPSVPASGPHALVLAVYRIRSTGVVTLRGATLLATTPIRIGKRATLAIGVRATAVVTGFHECGAVSRKRFRDYFTRCCVTCKKVTACGCKVEMECGTCCAGECCWGTTSPPLVARTAMHSQAKPRGRATGRKRKQTPARKR